MHDYGLRSCAFVFEVVYLNQIAKSQKMKESISISPIFNLLPPLFICKYLFRLMLCQSQFSCPILLITHFFFLPPKKIKQQKLQQNHKTPLSCNHFKISKNQNRKFETHQFQRREKTKKKLFSTFTRKKDPSISNCERFSKK